MNVSSRLRALGALGITMSMLLAACEAATVSPSPSAAETPMELITTPTAPASAPPTGPSLAPVPTAVVAPTSPAPPAPSATPVPSASAGGASAEPGGSWAPAGALAVWGSLQAAVPLGDGGALALEEDGTEAERWDPATAKWRPAAALNAPRADFAAVPLRDGRVLVTGGLDTHDNDRWQAYSSTYVYDPSTRAGSWTKVGLLGTARVAPAAALLPDGRVLVAGGAYKNGPAYDDSGSLGLTLAAWTPAAPGAGAGGRGPLDDIPPPSIGLALATAELFDPSTGRWSPTGSMRYARVGAAAATLSDGRVLVVGSAEPGSWWADVDPRAFDTAEVYDPATGHFSLVGGLPSIDRAEVAAAGVDLRDDPTFYDNMGFTDVGTLIALGDGGALVIGRYESSKHQGSVTRSFRFDARGGRWRQLGKASVVFLDTKDGGYRGTPGPDLGGAFAAALPDGQVLVAGGTSLNEAGTDWEASRIARLYDPVTNTWTRLPSMPEGRTRGVTVTLADRSILLVGGNDWYGGADYVYKVAVRFVSSP